VQEIENNMNKDRVLPMDDDGIFLQEPGNTKGRRGLEVIT